MNRADLLAAAVYLAIALAAAVAVAVQPWWSVRPTTANGANAAPAAPALRGRL